MRAVLATPPGPEQDHLYPHPDNSHPDDSAQGSDAPVGARVVGPGATDSLACRAPVARRPALLPAIDRDAYDHPRD